ncbi:MAG: hypothetical protein PUA82_02530 [Eubacteriales bacterium]|nr:hypothetical protein [Eubacteriales bacterium]
MKTYETVILAVILGFSTVLGFQIHRSYIASHSYYPMAGECKVIYKYTEQTGDFTDYYIIITDLIADDNQDIDPDTEAGSGGKQGRPFTLSCTEDQYNQVQAGDIVDCERDQTTTDYSGKVHSISHMPDDEIK